ncbi:DUF3800 domain-containing protein [Yersinia enterocolitica]|uniref:DUF3800 domain-containing protein n=1 Tax=Yersinia enterocolitica TaxID=630 RepID=UPI0005E112CF|nr:DUF3800 domain-containing protein [Yersinia enterocolitica]CNF90766.1 Protein of uncharacterised function (DUF3800) [Yersinia enterocolitica]HDL7463502.1 DUF3800 domain-containing protein [Yersinia enterocolitica]HEI6963353.1 DUF3800 domain-containing protein [Yersinia enterocolitica]
MTYNFYLDESGNTGDVANADEKFNFSSQPVFSLGCVGIPDNKEDDIFNFMEGLKLKHKIQGHEFKSKNIYYKKPELLVELFCFLKKNEFPVFVEIVDKRYFLIAHITNYIVLPALQTESEKSNFIRQSFAWSLYNNLPDSTLHLFIDSCESGTIQDTLKVISSIVEHYQNMVQDTTPIASCLLHSVLMTKDDINNALNENVNRHNTYIPSKDLLKNGSPSWMLPNLSSFCNVYARVNKSMRGKIANVKFIHDEQVQFDEIIKAAKVQIEKNNINAYTPASNYNFNEIANLSFESSTKKKGIQIADLVAGFCMRYIQNTCIKKERQPDIYKECYSVLNSILNANKSPSINQVVPHEFLILTSDLAFRL